MTANAAATEAGENLSPRVGIDANDAGRAAATDASAAIQDAIRTRGSARVVFASAPSQESMLAALVEDTDIDWSRLHAFHMDEYVGLPSDHAQAFGRWLEERLAPVEPGRLERIFPGADPAAEARRYAELLAAERPDPPDRPDRREEELPRRYAVLMVDCGRRHAANLPARGSPGPSRYRDRTD
jgi:6-phosphogluconolactonase/glucosamine-6-phosphate isomerase/deaminase